MKSIEAQTRRMLIFRNNMVVPSAFPADIHDIKLADKAQRDIPA
jgi:hypothetical protein